MATIDERIYDAAKAHEVLENPAFAGAFEAIKQEYLDAWKNSPARDAEGRESLFLMYRLTEKLQATLTGMIADGKQAQIHREHEESRLAKQRSAGLSMDPYSD